MPVGHRETLAHRLQRRLRREARGLCLRLAHLCDPGADLGAPAHIERHVFTPRVLGEPLPNLRFLYVGTCQIGHLAVPAAPLGCSIEHMLYDSGWGAELPPLDVARYDAVIVGLTLRTLVNQAYGAGFDLAHARETWDPDAATAAFSRCVDLVDDQLRRLHGRLGGASTFFFTFLEPSFSYIGQLHPAVDLDHPAAFVRRLNDALVERIADFPNFHVFDLNAAFNVVGRLHLQDDVVTNFTHAATIGTIDDSLDGERLTPAASNHHIYDVTTVLPILQSYVFRELCDAVKILRGVDRVKLIIVDLDDTLWRGVAADTEMAGWARIEGWPLGFAEALLYFKKRGGLLAICSKNDHDATVERFAQIWTDRLTLSDFVCVEINWRSKAQNIQAILDAANISADQALFIDDNPREIAEVQASFPTLRCLGGRVGSNPRDWRRIILRSPETQVAALSEESLRRTDLVRARIDRELAPRPVDRTAWLKSLELEARLFLIDDVRAPRFERALELINKTNQFNTTGRRWSAAELDAFLKAGGLCLAANLKDKTLDNGLIAVALVAPGEIVQVVLSCRVFGLGAEVALGAAAVSLALSGTERAVGRFADTGKNLSCRDYFQDLGFTLEDDVHVARTAPQAPDWIAVELDRNLKTRLGELSLQAL
jgi:FkbH-like protein